MKEIPAHTQRTLDSGRVCSGCGGRLEGIETVDNSGNPTVWAGCKNCSKFDGGVPENVFKIAEKLFESGERYYKHMIESEYNTDGEKEYYFSSQMSGLTGLVWKILKLEEDVNNQ